MTDGTKQVKQTDYEWYTDSSGITRRRSRYWHGFWGTFWGLFMCLNLLAILLLGATIVWATFDIHERLPFALLAQIPALLMLAIRRIFR